jgi:hypothetical protein
MSLRPALVDAQGGPITGKRGGPMSLAKPAASWSHVAGKRQYGVPMRKTPPGGAYGLILEHTPTPACRVPICGSAYGRITDPLADLDSRDKRRSVPSDPGIYRWHRRRRWHDRQRSRRASTPLNGARIARPEAGVRGQADLSD